MIEIDGSSHNSKINDDNFRDKRLIELGLEVIRYFDFEVKKNIDNIYIDLNEKIKNHIHLLTTIYNNYN